MNILFGNPTISLKRTLEKKILEGIYAEKYDES